MDRRRSARKLKNVATGNVEDPVCGMEVDPADSAGHFDYGSKTFYFCSTHCLDEFKAEPERYLQPKTPAESSKIHTCPMHPEIRHEGPGTCPICGMALEPLAMTADD